MAIEVKDLQFFYSGSGVTTGAGSLGGVKSATQVGSQTASAPSLVTGVSFVQVLNNLEGNGLLTYSSATQTLGWKPPSSLTTYSLVITVDGTYAIGGTDGQIVVAVTVSALPTSFKQDTIAITNQFEKVFSNVAAAESLVGSVKYRCLYVKNAHASLTASGVKLFIAQLTTGADEIEIGLDPAGVGNGSSTGVATTIANETTAPSGVSFSSPTAGISGLSVGTMTAGQCFAFWEKRTVPANSTGNTAQNTSQIGVVLTS